jgi:hypothetical protein
LDLSPRISLVSLLALSGSRLRSAAIVSLRAVRRYVAIAALGVTLVPVVSLAAKEFRTARPRLHPSSPLAGTRVHDLHLTYSRVEVTGHRILWRVRLFRDDLEKSLQVYSHRPTLDASTRAADSVFAAYFNSHVRITALGTRLAGAVFESGRDPDAPEPEMWWYLLELRAPAPIRTLSIQVGLLFEHFADQRNVVTITQMHSGQRRSLYFSRTDSMGRAVF